MAHWLQVSPERSTANSVTAGWRRRGGAGAEGTAINPGCSHGLPLVLHVGWGDKLIMWLRLIR